MILQDFAIVIERVTFYNKGNRVVEKLLFPLLLQPQYFVVTETERRFHLLLIDGSAHMPSMPSSPLRYFSLSV